MVTLTESEFMRYFTRFSKAIENKSPMKIIQSLFDIVELSEIEKLALEFIKNEYKHMIATYYIKKIESIDKLLYLITIFDRNLKDIGEKPFFKQPLLTEPCYPFIKQFGFVEIIKTMLEKRMQKKHLHPFIDYLVETKQLKERELTDLFDESPTNHKIDGRYAMTKNYSIN